MSTINIPASVDKAVAELTGIGTLMQAREWERAAIVWALVGPSPGAGRPVIAGNPAITVSGLAAHRIVGLRDRDTIALYRDRWQAAINEGAAGPISLGDTIIIPDDWDWPPNDSVGERDASMTDERRDRLMEAGREAGMPKGSKVVDIAANPKSLRAAIKADPATARAAREALEEASQERHDQMIREAGGNPAGVQAFEGDDITDWNHEVSGIKIRMGNLRGDIQRARRNAEQRGIPAGRLEELLGETLGALNSALYGEVPDTVEGLTQ